MQAYKRHMCVDEKGDKQQGWYSSLDQGGKCTLAMKMVKAEWAANGSLAFNPWEEVVGPMVKKYIGEHAVAASIDDLAKTNPAAMFTNAFCLKYGSTHFVRLFGFIGYGGTEDKSVAAVMRTLEKYVERLDLVPDSVPNYAGQPYDFAGAKNTCKMDLQTAAVRALVDFAGRIRGALDSPPLTAVRPTPFAEEGGGFQDALVDIEALLKKMEDDVKIFLRLSRATEAAAARAGVIPQVITPLGSRSGASEASVGPSVSQVGSLPVAPLTASALAALQGQSRIPSEFSRPAPSQAPGGQMRGALANTLAYDSGGVWVNTVHGAKWCSAKGPRPINLEGLCPASLLPNTVERDAYCTGGSECEHYLPRGFSRVLATKVLPAHTLVVKPGKGGRGGDKRGGDGRGGGKSAAPAADTAEAPKKKKLKKKKAKGGDQGDE